MLVHGHELMEYTCVLRSAIVSDVVIFPSLCDIKNVTHECSRIKQVHFNDTGRHGQHSVMEYTHILMTNEELKE